MTTTKATKTTKNPNRYLEPGTLVVNREDAEPGQIISICTLRRGGNSGAFSYLVETAYGREVWEVGTLFVPETTND